MSDDETKNIDDKTPEAETAQAEEPQTEGVLRPRAIKTKTARGKKDSNAISAETGAFDEASTTSEKLQNRLSKENLKKGAIAGLALIVIITGFSLFKPYKGGQTFGACKTFLELMVRYPLTVRYSMVEDFGKEVRIWYTHMDPFGQERLEYLQCVFRQDPQTGMALEKANLNRRPIDPETIARFNPSIPAIFAYPPDLTYPPPLPSSISDLQLETRRFRRPIF